MPNLELVRMFQEESALIGGLYDMSAGGTISLEQRRKTREGLIKLRGVIDALLDDIPNCDEGPLSHATIDGMTVLDTFDEPIETENAIWLRSTEPRHAIVAGCECVTDDDEWNFGAEWNGNVARHVSFLSIDTQNQWEAPPATVLFNGAFDENAVDIATSDGRLHLLFAQGLVADSLCGVWRGIRYRSMRQWYGMGDGDSRITIPTIDVRRKSDADGSYETMFSVSCANMAEEGHRDGDSERSRISFNDVFVLFAYEAPYEGYDARRDLKDVSVIDVAMLVTDIKVVQGHAERLTDYDPHWGEDIIS